MVSVISGLILAKGTIALQERGQTRHQTRPDQDRGLETTRDRQRPDRPESKTSKPDVDGQCATRCLGRCVPDGVRSIKEGTEDDDGEREGRGGDGGGTRARGSGVTRTADGWFFTQCGRCEST